MEIFEGINKNTHLVLFSDESNITEYDEFTDRDCIFADIDSLTKLSDSKINKKTRFNFKLRKKDNIFTIKKGNLKYKFLLMDQFIACEEVKQELRSDNRYGKCCSTAIAYSLSSEEDMNIIIGYLNIFGEKIIHAVMERIRNNEPYIFDYTRNLVMKKEEYFDITNFEVLNVVKNSDLKEDIELLRGLNIYAKPYLIFRDEIMRDLTKCVKKLKLEE